MHEKQQALISAAIQLISQEGVGGDAAGKIDRYPGPEKE